MLLLPRYNLLHSPVLAQFITKQFNAELRWYAVPVGVKVAAVFRSKFISNSIFM
jgi:hypothetical protein